MLWACSLVKKKVNQTFTHSLLTWQILYEELRLTETWPPLLLLFNSFYSSLQLLHFVFVLPVSCLLLVVKLTHTESRLNSLVTLRLGRAKRCHMSAGRGGSCRLVRSVSEGSFTVVFPHIKHLFNPLLWQPSASRWLELTEAGSDGASPGKKSRENLLM